MTAAGLNRLKRKWQKRLGLTDWVIRVRFVDEETMARETGAKDALGVSLWVPDRKTAKIYVLQPREFKALEKDELIPATIEETLVHELLHILLEGHLVQSPSNINTERALNQLAKVLCGK